MRISATKEKKAFTPIVLSIIIESQEDLDTLKSIAGNATAGGIETMVRASNKKALFNVMVCKHMLNNLYQTLIQSSSL